ncbi:hypothetical protein NXS19_007470 [Fusarium pseudograminearum]|nr:hypothetical protein NXS19_007470 [Fusarium pseudograminearum]
MSQNDDAQHEDDIQYASMGVTREELEEKYPNRPKNHSKTLVFSELFREVFNPLNENKKQNAAGSGPKNSFRGVNKLSPTNSVGTSLTVSSPDGAKKLVSISILRCA